MLTGHQTMVDLEDSFDPHALVARWSTSLREAAERLLDLYEKGVQRLADAHVNSARPAGLPAVTAIAETQATLSRDVADACVRSVRKLLES